MRFRFPDNRRWRRAQAGLISAVYVLLCTLGALTHNHAAGGMDDDTFKPSDCRIAGAHAAVHLDKGAQSSVLHCAYCDWQNSSVSPALPAQQLAAPAKPQLDALSSHINCINLSCHRASSRAPPIA